MAFDSFSAFIAMEGHGPYVWSYYAVFFIFLAGMMIWSVRRHRSVIEACRRRLAQQDATQGKDARPKPQATFTRVEVSQD